MTSIIFQLQERTILVSVPLAFRLKVARVRYERVGNRVIIDPSCNFRVEVSLT
jgi:virulence-associated protein VagC